jgi:Na+/glutamate symporter
MSTGEFMRELIVCLIVGAVSATLVRVEPFRSNYWLALLAGGLLGLILGAVEIAAKKLKKNAKG